MSKVTIYHNPDCGTSRNTLAMIRDKGIEPEVIEYVKNPPTREKLKELVKRMGVGIRDILRRNGTPYDELKLDDPSLSDEQLVEMVMKHPILMQRPIVESERGVRLCRPVEKVNEVLP
jgi:arsenate reductase (glutaredoxin)